MSGMAIRASVQDGVAVLSVLNGSTTLAFLGASCPTSVLSGSNGLSSVTLSPNKGEDAVVALTTFTRYGGKNPDINEGGLVRLRWEGDKLFVDTDKPFISAADRLGQVVPNESMTLQMMTRGQMFALSFADQGCRRGYEDNLLSFGFRLVGDANLLCRYLVGQATFEELEAVASGDLRTAEQIRIAELEEHNGKLAGVVRVLEGETLRLGGAVDAQEDEIGRLKAELERDEGLLRLTQNTCESHAVALSEKMGEVERLRNQLNQTLGAKWRRFCYIARMGVVPTKNVTKV